MILAHTRTVFWPGSLLKPDLDGLVPCPHGDRSGYRLGEVFLKAAWASGSDLGCCGRTDSRRKPSAANCLPTVRSCRVTPNSTVMRACRSRRRQRTTPSFSASGPASTHAASVVICSGVSRRGRCGTVRFISPARPSALVRCTRSAGKPSPGRFPDPPHRSVWRSMPQVLAACSRSFAIATRTHGATIAHPEPAQSPASAAPPARPASCPQQNQAPSSLTPSARPQSLPWQPPRVEVPLIQTSSAKGIPKESSPKPVGITAYQSPSL